MSVVKPDLVRFYRGRRAIVQMQLIGEYNHKIISRAENYHQDIRFDAFSDVLDLMGIPVDTSFCMYLEDTTVEAYEIRDQILFYLEWADESLAHLCWAKEFLGKLKKLGDFENGLNKQFKLSCEARILEFENAPPEVIIKITEEGIRLTYPEYNPETFKGDVLLFEEAALMQVRVKAVFKIDPAAAIKQIGFIIEGLKKQPNDDRDKEKFLAPIYLDLSRFLINTGDYAKALETNETGKGIAIKRNRGRYTIDFVYNEAVIHIKNNEKEKGAFPLELAYFCFIATRRYKKVAEVLKLADEHNIKFETFNMDAVRYNLPVPNFKHGSVISANGIGGLIDGFLKETGMKQKELCQGVCTQPALNKIISGETKNTLERVYHLEVFFEKLGRDIDKYITTFLSKETFEGKQLRNKIRTMLVNRQYEDAQPLLEELKKHKDFKKDNVNLQFIASFEASIHAGLKGYDDKHMDLLRKAWAFSKKKDFDLTDNAKIAVTRLSNRELTIINQAAINLCRSGKRPQGIKIFEALLDNMDRFYVDEAEKMRMYIAVLCSYSSHLERAGRNQESLDRAMVGEELCIKHMDLHLLPFFFDNKACAYFNLGEKEKSFPYAILTYYTSVLIGRTDDADISRKYIKKNFDIDVN